MRQKQLSQAEIASFFSQAAMLFHAGITPTESMTIMLQDTSSSEGKTLLSSILATCRSGNSFAHALENTNAFPDYVIHMVHLGEESGNLDVVTQSLSDYYEREESIFHSIRSAVSYPLIMIAMMILVIYVLITKVLPIFNQVFVQLGSELTGFSRTLLGLGNSLSNYSIILITVIVVIALCYLLALKTKKGRKVANMFLCQFPLTKKFNEKVAAGKFASSISLALSSGMDTFTSLDLVSKLVDHKGTTKKIEKCKADIKSGSNFSEALSASGIFTNAYSRMVSVGFRSGQVDSTLKKIAGLYQKETNRKIHAMISVIEPTLVIILSLIVGMILLSVILPLMGIMSNMG